MDVNGAAEDASAKASSQKHEGHSVHTSSDDMQKTRLLPDGIVDPTSPDISTKARELTSQILHFLSHASNETLGACVVGLGAITYVLLGRIGLILIGMFGGVILHAAWEENSSEGKGGTSKTAESRKRREKGLEIIQRVLDLRDRARSEGGAEDDPEIRAPLLSSELGFTGFQSSTKRALESFTNAVIRDYVDWWYKPMLPMDTIFPRACRQTLTGFTLSVSSHLSRKRPADVFLDFLTNSSSIIIVFLSELSGALTASRELEPKEAIDEYLQENPRGSLANVLDQKQQNSKLTAVAEDILRTFLDGKAFDCDPARTFLREVLARLILEMTVTKCSSADFINEWIIYALGEGDPTDLVQAIDEGVVNSTNHEIVKEAAASATISAPNHLSSTVAPTDSQSTAKAEHKRTVSRAEQAMEEAMREAQALNEMIAAEETRRNRASEQREAISDPSSSNPTYLDSNANDVNGADEAQSITAVQNGNIVAESPHPNASEPTAGFKSFDQILASQQPTALRSDASASQPSSPSPLTLHNATLSIFDDSMPGDKGTIRSKPAAEYLLQIEPSSSHYPGWMIARRYPDFETLHEVLRRISVVSGVAAFVQRHQTLPSWKSKTKSNLRMELEKYLQDALSYQRLAESEGMKRFLEKEQHTGRPSPGTKQGGLGFPSPATFENMGKGMMDVLSSAPKGAATGGKALVGGVTGVFGGVGSLGQKKQGSKAFVGTGSSSAVGSNTNLSGLDDNHFHSYEQLRPSTESLRRPEAASRESIQLERKPSTDTAITTPSNPSQSFEQDKQMNGTVTAGTAPSEDTESSAGDVGSQKSNETKEQGSTSLHLPPPPSEISDDYSTSQSSPKHSLDDNTTARTSTSTAHTSSQASTAPSLQTHNTPSTKTSRRDHYPLTLQETTVAVELFFATINELYTLSSAWTLRLTLLNTAKTFLLRPGNANLEAIRHLLQTTIISANTSDPGIAAHINSMRANALPTEEELKAWPPPPTDEERERRRVKARKLLVERGMPQALTSVMGQAASGEALGKVFDCLQIKKVARGLVFALVLQAVRAVTQ